MSAFAWLGEFLKGMTSFIPRLRLVKAGHGAIRYSPRGKSEVLKPALYIYWPMVQAFEDFPTAGQTIEVPKQALLTKDLKTVSVGAAMTFEVEDLQAFCVDNWNTFDDVDDIAQVAVRDVVKEHTLAEIQTDPEMDEKLRRAAQRRLRNYGVRVKRMAIKTFAPSQLIHVIGDQAPGVVLTQPPAGDSE